MSASVNIPSTDVTSDCRSIYNRAEHRDDLTRIPADLGGDPGERFRGAKSNVCRHRGIGHCGQITANQTKSGSTMLIGNIGPVVQTDLIANNAIEKQSNSQSDGPGSLEHWQRETESLLSGREDFFN
jgi:hypothetical protein